MTSTDLPNSTSLADLAQRYTTFFIDQFGVLHDGMKPYPGAVDALVQLKGLGKTIILLSNSGKRSSLNVQRLGRLGFCDEGFDRMVTSGEAAWHMLGDQIEKGILRRGSRCLLLARDNDRSAIEGLDLVEVDDAINADVILLTGSQGDVCELDDYRQRLAVAAERKVACVCTNPDKIMLTDVGLRFGAGQIAQAYADMGGPVTWIGKPYAHVYQFALQLAGNPDPFDVCCIGDSVEHDIAGGASLGFATALVQTGILTDASASDFQHLFEEHGVKPDYLLKSLTF